MVRSMLCAVALFGMLAVCQKAQAIDNDYQVVVYRTGDPIPTGAVLDPVRVGIKAVAYPGVQHYVQWPWWKGHISEQFIDVPHTGNNIPVQAWVRKGWQVVYDQDLGREVIVSWPTTLSQWYSGGTTSVVFQIEFTVEELDD